MTAGIRVPLVTRLALRVLERSPEGGERLFPGSLTAYVRGRRVRARVRWCRSDAAIFREVFVEGTYDLDYDDLVGPVRTVVDVGAHVGLASLYFRARFPTARLVSVEPLPHNFVVLERNRRGDVREWALVVGAVGSAARMVTLHWSRWWSSGSVVEAIATTRQSDPGRAEHRVAEAPLSVATVDVAAVGGGRRLDVVKLDVEGAEEELLTAAPEWLSSVGCLLIEVHDKYIDGARVRAAIEAAGLVRVQLQRGRTEVYVRPTGQVT